MKVHLVDGTYELFRAYYGAPAASGPDGREVGGTRALMRSLLSLLDRPEVTHVGVAFDTVIESFRNDLFDGYKTGDGIDPDLFAQFPLAEEATRALSLVTWSMIEFEADDALAAAAARFAEDERVEQVVVCTPDKDLMQCVRGHSVISWDRLRDKTYDDAGVREKFGIPPRSIPDYLALVGDTADGIPGVPRWGAKSASTVLARYGRLEDIPSDPSHWDVKVRGAAALGENLGRMRDEALLYRHLATLRIDVPLPEDLEAMQWRGAHRESLLDLCQRLGDNRLVERVSKWQSQ